MTAASAASSRSAAASSPRCRNISTPLNIMAIGFTLFIPLYFGALPWVASNTATSSPMFAPGATPSPPINPAHRSLMMSPYRFGSTSTSYSSGRDTSCIEQLSTMRSSNSMAGNPSATSRATSRNSPSVNFMMLALCTAVTFLRPYRCAYWNA